jgi:hypothetical protein
MSGKCNVCVVEESKDKKENESIIVMKVDAMDKLDGAMRIARIGHSYSVN